MTYSVSIKAMRWALTPKKVERYHHGVPYKEVILLRTKPPKFESGQQLIDLWSDFCEEIAESEYRKVPTQTEFCRWLSVRFEETDRKTIYNYLNRYFPTIKATFESIQSDTIASGAMLGKYNSTMSIFGLKNWCGWGDGGKVADYGTEQQEDDPLTKALKEEAERLDNER